MRIKEIKITPDVVVAGGELTIEATGYLYEPVLPGATADVIVKLGVVRLLHKKFDLCNELEKNKDSVELQCPVEQGLITVKTLVMFCFFLDSLTLYFQIDHAKSHIAKRSTKGELIFCFM